MITLHFHLQPQYKYESFLIIYISLGEILFIERCYAESEYNTRLIWHFSVADPDHEGRGEALQYCLAYPASFSSFRDIIFFTTIRGGPPLGLPPVLVFWPDHTLLVLPHVLDPRQLIMSKTLTIAWPDFYFCRVLISHRCIYYCNTKLSTSCASLITCNRKQY